MPLTIRELHIKVSVGQPGTPGAQQSPGPASPQQETQEKEELVADCVEQVVHIINEKKER